MKKFIERLVTEGGRVFWTAVEAAAGVLGAYVVPDDLFDFAGDFEPFALGAVAVAIAAAATALKERARKALGGE